MPDFSSEISFKTARSGGKGGQNVNKVETAVWAFLHLRKSALLTQEEKQLAEEKLRSKINEDGLLYVKSQTFRTQLDNKHDAIAKINLLVQQALVVSKKRKAVKVPRIVKEKRLENKKRNAEIKQARKKINF